jgi:hypothetical protein
VYSKKQKFRPSRGVAHSPAPLPIQTDRSTSTPAASAVRFRSPGPAACYLARARPEDGWSRAACGAVEGGEQARRARAAGRRRLTAVSRRATAQRRTVGAVVASGLASKRHRLQLRLLSSPVPQEIGTAARLHAVVLRTAATED